MTLRENTLAILNYQKYGKMPVVSFGYWNETLDTWAEQGHVTGEEARDYRENGDGCAGDVSVMKKLGFDYNWGGCCVNTNVLLLPRFEETVLETFADGSRVIRNSDGLICRDKPGTVTIPAEIGTSLTGREAWETQYKPRLRPDPQRSNSKKTAAVPPVSRRELPAGIYAGSLIGNMRNLLGVEQLSYLYADDEELWKEIADTMCGLCFETVRTALESGVQFDFMHFWEDICFKNGPLVSPSVMEEIIAPWYKKITDEAAKYGVTLVSLDCDGLIDSLLPIWLKNGINIMFPIEVGTWNASLAPWRAAYGKTARGVGGMNKTVFSRDRAAVDAECERLKKLIELGGYIPCPDHRIAPDAEFDLVRYYCEKMQNLN